MIDLLVEVEVLDDALLGDLAAEVLVVCPRLEVLIDVALRVGFAVPAFTLDFARAVAVREAADRELELARGAAAAFLVLLRDDAPRLLADDGLVDFFAELRPPALRAPVELLFEDEEALTDFPRDVDLPLAAPARDEPVLRVVDEPPFLPAALFLAELLFEAPPEDFDEPELFFEPPLVFREPEDERELEDFFVVAILFTSSL